MSSLAGNGRKRLLSFSRERLRREPHGGKRRVLLSPGPLDEFYNFTHNYNVSRSWNCRSCSFSLVLFLSPQRYGFTQLIRRTCVAFLSLFLSHFLPIFLSTAPTEWLSFIISLDEPFLRETILQVRLYFKLKFGNGLPPRTLLSCSDCEWFPSPLPPFSHCLSLSLPPLIIICSLITIPKILSNASSVRRFVQIVIIEKIWSSHKIHCKSDLIKRSSSARVTGATR